MHKKLNQSAVFKLCTNVIIWKKNSRNIHKINYILIHAQKVITYLHIQFLMTPLVIGKNRHYLSTDLLVGQDCQLPLYSPLPVCFIQSPVFSLAPPWNSNSCDTSHSTIYCFLSAVNNQMTQSIQNQLSLMATVISSTDPMWATFAI